jgi:hypothetical protein
VSPAATETLSAGFGAAHSVRGIAPNVACADTNGMRLLLMLVAVAHLGGDPGLQTISGTITANSGSALTVTSPKRTLTCSVTYEKGQAVILKWGTGVRVGMACKRTDGGLVVVKLVRLGTKEPTAPTPGPEPRKAIGVVSALTSTSVTVGDLTCLITPAADSQAAAAKLTLGASVGILCRPDGTAFVLSGATIVESPAPVPAPTTDLKKAIGIVTALSDTSVTVGDLTCSITGASDSQAAKAKLTIGAKVGIVCRPDGGRFVLSGATLAS